MDLKESDAAVDAEMVLRTLAGGYEVHLSGCRIEGTLDLNRLFLEKEAFDTERIQSSVNENGRTLVFSQPVHFNSCVFEGDVVFSGPWEQPDCLKVIFEKEVIFNSSVFNGQTRFSYAVFKNLAGFDGCTFQRICTFVNAVFYDRAMFRTTTFEGYGLFNEARFEADTRFANTCFGKGVNFKNVIFKNKTDFSGVYSRHKSVPLHDNVSFSRYHFGDDASFWRFVKQVCQEAGHYQQAGECFYRERCANFWVRFRGPNYENLSAAGKAVRWLWGTRLLPEFVFGRLLFGYGERPVRVLAAGVIIIIACALFYSSGAANLAYDLGLETPHLSGPLSFSKGLYFSTVTFTTLGYGDIYPAADSLTRYVVMFEALAGMCLVALFVVSLGKRFSRG